MRSIIIKISPDLYFKKGHAMLLVSYEDWAKLEKGGWNMEKPIEGKDYHRQNLITFKPRKKKCAKV